MGQIRAESVRRDGNEVRTDLDMANLARLKVPLSIELDT